MEKEASMRSNSQSGLILVVDDEERHRRLLRDMLEADGYRVEVAKDGKTALERVKEAPPDVILLDVMMPGVDGFEVCRQLKKAPETAPIPVLLVTSLSEREDRIAGIRAGANDFLTKPVNLREVMLRVKNALYAKWLFDQVQQNLKRLKELEALRDSLIHMVVHDMRTPLTVMTANLSFLEETAAKKLDFDEKESLKDAHDSTNTLMKMVNSLLDISRLEAGKMPLNLTGVDLCMLVHKALTQMGTLVASERVHCDPCGRSVPVACDSELILRVVINLVGNAIKFASNEGKVRIEVRQDDHYGKISVTDTGPGIPPEYHEKVFEKFGQVETIRKGKHYSTGLGLAFCKLAVEAHGGRIGVDSRVGRGSTFWFLLPAETQRAEDGGA